MKFIKTPVKWTVIACLAFFALLAIIVVSAVMDADMPEIIVAAEEKVHSAAVEAVRDLQLALPEKQPKRATTWRDRDQSSMAYHTAAYRVEGRLVAPSTARFPGIFDGRAGHVTRLGGQRYRIRSYVDSQNSFGAQVRTHFTAEVEQTGRGVWRVRSLELHE